MNCRDAQDLLIRRQDEKPAAAENRQLQEHLAVCADCRLLMSGLKKTEELFERERQANPRPGDPTELWQRVSDALGEPASALRRSVSWMRAALAGTGLALAASILVALSLWRWGVGVQRDMDGLKDDHTELQQQYEDLRAHVAASGAPLVTLAVDELERSTRLYWELADFYRLPVLWVVEGDRGVEMKLGLEPAVAPRSEAEADLLFLAVTIADKQDPDASTTVRIVTRPGRRISAELEELSVGQGHWRLECVPTAFGRDGLAVALKLEHISATAPAVLATEVTLFPGTVAKPGSLVVAGRTYTVQVVGQRAARPGAGPPTKRQGQAT